MTRLLVTNWKLQMLLRINSALHWYFWLNWFASAGLRSSFPSHSAMDFTIPCATSVAVGGQLMSDVRCGMQLSPPFPEGLCTSRAQTLYQTPPSWWKRSGYVRPALSLRSIRSTLIGQKYLKGCTALDPIRLFRWQVIAKKIQSFWSNINLVSELYVVTQEDLFALTCYLHLKSWSQQKIWAKSFHSCRATLPATGNIGVNKNWKGKMATVRKGSIEWPTTVDCEDAFKSACKNDTYTYCV